MLTYRSSLGRTVSSIRIESTSLSIRPAACRFLSAREPQNARLYNAAGEAGAPIVKKERRHRPDRPRPDPSSKDNRLPIPRHRFLDKQNAGENGISPRKVFSIKFTDPLQLSESVLGKLRRDKFEEALALTEKNSAGLECTVAWNHLIDYQCKKGKMNSAIKTYNSMKKRGQSPDGYTFTIIFRGLAAAAQTHPSAVQNALSIYHSMDSPTSPVAPNPIHTNAVLTVCAKAEDLDAMFGVAAKLKERGVRAPNSQTYTIMFNAMRTYMRKTSENLSVEEFLPIRSKMVMDARRMWQDIVRRWRHGDMWIDEELVCAMGRLLMLGGPADRNDIPALLRQTMKLPQLLMRNEREIAARLAPALPEPSFDEDLEDDVRFAEEGLEEWEKAELNISPKPSPSPAPRTPVIIDQFQPITPPRRSDTKSKGLSSFAVPSNNTLNLLLDAFPEPKYSVAAMLYWKLLTSIYNVEPDMANYHAYLRILRIARLSDESAKVVAEMPKDMLETGTFRIAIAACVRDKTNPKAFANAEKIIDVMTKRGQDADIAMLHSYLDVALDTSADIDEDRFRLAPKMVIKPNVVEGMKKALSECGLENMHFHLRKLTEPAKVEEVKESTPATQREEKFERGKRVSSALSRCEPVLEKLQDSLPRMSPEKKALVLKLAQRMISAYDQLMDRGMAPRDQFRALGEKRSKLAALVTTESNKYIPEEWTKMKNASFKTWKKGGAGEGALKREEERKEMARLAAEALEKAKKENEEKW